MPYIAEFLTDSDPWLRAAAIVSLGNGPASEKATTKLTELAESDDSALAVLSLLAVGRVRDRGALAALGAALTSAGGWKARMAAGAALAHFDPGDAEAGPLYIKALQMGAPLPAASIHAAYIAGMIDTGTVRNIVSDASLPAEGEPDYSKSSRGAAGKMSPIFSPVWRSRVLTPRSSRRWLRSWQIWASRHFRPFSPWWGRRANGPANSDCGPSAEYLRMRHSKTGCG